MPLTNDQILILQKAISEYSFPCDYYDFLNDYPVPQKDMFSVEKLIRSDLISGNILLIKNGLSNVLYWGYAQIGYREKRVKRFRNEVTEQKLRTAGRLFQNIVGDGLKEIKAIKLPEFSGMSFITKIRMFLDPKNYAILDQQILKMNEVRISTFLNNIAFGNKETQIRISERNIEVYNNWCRKCKNISDTYYNGEYRAVDAERGFFNLIKMKQSRMAATILSTA